MGLGVSTSRRYNDDGAGCPNSTMGLGVPTPRRYNDGAGCLNFT